VKALDEVAAAQSLEARHPRPPMPNDLFHRRRLGAGEAGSGLALTQRMGTDRSANPRDARLALAPAQDTVGQRRDAPTP
jgi:hypothetical protein